MCCGEGIRSVLCWNLGRPDKDCERFRRGYGPTYNRVRGVVFEWIRVIVDSDVVVTLIPCHGIERVVLGVDVGNGRYRVEKSRCDPPHRPKWLENIENKWVRFLVVIGRSRWG